MPSSKQLQAGIIVFDGICGLCSRSVQFLLRHDRHRLLSFVALQTPLGQDLLRRHDLDPTDAKTFLFIRGDEAFTTSDAVLETLRYLGPWRPLRVLQFVPRPIRHRMYDFVSRHRYRLFGTTDTCFIPTPEQKGRLVHAVATVSDER